jgi:hypothetical protein
MMIVRRAAASDAAALSELEIGVRVHFRARLSGRVAASNGFEA